MRWFAVLWAGGTYLVLLRLPVYGQLGETVSSDGTRTLMTGRATLSAVNGPGTYLILAVPVLAALTALLPWPGKLRRMADIAGAVVATAFVLLGLMTVGAFFLPSAAALVAVALAARPSSRRTHYGDP